MKRESPAQRKGKAGIQRYFLIRKLNLTFFYSFCRQLAEENGGRAYNFAHPLQIYTFTAEVTAEIIIFLHLYLSRLKQKKLTACFFVYQFDTPTNQKKKPQRVK